MSELADLRDLVGCTCPTAKRRSTSARVGCNKCGASAIVGAQASIEYAEDTVTYTGPDARPPNFAIAHAESAAYMSPCRKSKRGVGFYLAMQELEDGQELARETYVEGYNGPPWVWSVDDSDYELACDGSESCRRDCSVRCVHAEARAIMDLPPYLSESPARLRMVHVKIDHFTGRVVPGNGPSCVACSKIILDRGIGGIWLYEKGDGVWVDAMGQLTNAGAWRYYPALEFHEISLATSGVYQIRRAAPRRE